MNNKFSIILIILIFSSFSNSIIYSQETINSDLSNDECYNCHVENDILPDGFSELDIHIQEGLSCAGCHGGDPTISDEEESMNPSKGFVGVPDVKDIPMYCGKCHSKIEIMRVYQPRIETDQVTQYYTSVHGKKLKRGDENVATCISCHSSHSILPATDTRSTVYPIQLPHTCNKCHGNSEIMNKYNLDANQFELYSKSVHGIALLENKDIGAPSCNDCHGNHGAAPPGLASVAHVCGTCHVNNMNYFKNTEMAQAFEDADFHGCEECHGNHLVEKTNDDMIGVGENSLCTDCHAEREKGYSTAVEIRRLLKDLTNEYDSVSNKLVEVKNKGMNDIEIEYKLQEGKQNLIQSRTLIHTFSTERVNEKTSEGIKVLKEAALLSDEEIDKYYTRRNGFAIATLIFIIIAIALYFRIREMGKKT